MTDVLAVPTEGSAEQVVVGCSVATVHGAAPASDRPAADDFYWPAHARLFVAARGLVDVEIEQDASRCARPRRRWPSPL